MEHIIHLNKDPRLATIMQYQEPPALTRRKNVYLHLCTSIMSQQLSTRVAAVFHERFLNLYGRKRPTAQDIVNTPFNTLRGIGLSNSKAHYIQNVCRFWIAEDIADTDLYKMSNQEILNYLTQIKGVGQWTVEMLLMFTLARENVFSAGDLGIQQAMCRLYGIESKDKKKMITRMQKIASKWEPYQTYACRYLWGWKDGS